MSEYEEGSCQDSLVDYLSDPASCVMTDADLISCLLRQRDSEAHPDYMIGSRQYGELVDHQIDAVADELFLLLSQTVAEDQTVRFHFLHQRCSR